MLSKSKVSTIIKEYDVMQCSDDDEYTWRLEGEHLHALYTCYILQTEFRH